MDTTMNDAVATVLNMERVARHVSLPELTKAAAQIARAAGRPGLSKTTVQRYLAGSSSTSPRALPIQAVDDMARALGMTFVEVAAEAQRRIDRERRRTETPGPEQRERELPA